MITEYFCSIWIPTDGFGLAMWLFRVEVTVSNKVVFPIEETNQLEQVIEWQKRYKFNRILVNPIGPDEKPSHHQINNLIPNSSVALIQTTNPALMRTQYQMKVQAGDIKLGDCKTKNKIQARLQQSPDAGVLAFLAGCNEPFAPRRIAIKQPPANEKLKRAREIFRSAASPMYSRTRFG